MKDHYKRLIKYLIDNVPVGLTGIAYFSALNGYRNLCLGMLHALFDSDYQLKIGMILCAEVGFMVFSWKLLRRNNFFESKWRVWINQFTGVLRLIMVWTYLFDEQTMGPNGSIYE
jgi:hypothetical protein